MRGRFRRRNNGTGLADGTLVRGSVEREEVARERDVVARARGRHFGSIMWSKLIYGRLGSWKQEGAAFIPIFGYAQQPWRLRRRCYVPDQATGSVWWSRGCK